MSTVQLGAGMARKELGSLLDAQSIVDAIYNAVLDAVRRDIKQPIVNVAPPQVTMSPVSVPAPQVTVNVPETETEAPVVNVTVPGLDALATQVRQLDQHVVALTQLLAQPVVKDVQRDGNDLITRVTEHR